MNPITYKSDIPTESLYSEFDDSSNSMIHDRILKSEVSEQYHQNSERLEYRDANDTAVRHFGHNQNVGIRSVENYFNVDDVPIKPSLNLNQVTII